MKKQFVAMLFSRGLSTLLQAANLILIARTVGLADFGLLGVMTSVAVLVSTIFDLGMTTMISKSTSLNRTDVVARALKINHLTSLALVMGSGLAFFMATIANGAPAWAIVLAVALGLEKRIETSLSVFIAEGNKLIPNVSALARRAVPFLGSLAAIILGAAPLMPYAVCYLLVCLADMLVIDQRLARKFGIRKSANRGLLNLVHQAWPFYVGNLTAHMRFLDTSVVALFTSVQGAALYSAASKVTNPLQLIPNTLTALILPHSARLDPLGARRLMNRLCLIFGSLLLVLVPVSLWSERIITLLFGTSFADAGPVLTVALIGLPFVTLSSPMGSILQSQGFEKFVALNGLVFSILLLVALCVFSAAWGIVGAAIAGAVIFALKCLSLYIKSRCLDASSAV